MVGDVKKLQALVAELDSYIDKVIDGFEDRVIKISVAVEALAEE